MALTLCRQFDFLPTYHYTIIVPLAPQTLVLALTSPQCVHHPQGKGENYGTDAVLCRQFDFLPTCRPDMTFAVD